MSRIASAVRNFIGTAESLALRVPAHWIIMSTLFASGIGLGYVLLPGPVQRVAMLERDGQSQQARLILEQSYNAGDRSFRTLYQLQALYEHFGQLDKAGATLQELLAARPRDINVQRRAASFFKMTQDEPAYIETLKTQIDLRYSEEACKELIGILRRIGKSEQEQSAILSCRQKGYRRAEDTIRLAQLIAADGDLAQASSLLRGVDDVRRLKNERDRSQLFVILLETDQPREAHRRAVRWLRGAREPVFALSLIDHMVIANKHDMAIALARDVSNQGDSVSLAVAEVMLDRGETYAAKTYLRGWIDTARMTAIETVARFVSACLDAEDPENALAGARKYGLDKIPQENLVALAEALAATDRKSDFDVVRASIRPDVVAGNPLLGAAIALGSGTTEASKTLLSTVAVDELDEWRLSLWARLMANTGRSAVAAATLQRMGVETTAQAQPERVVLEPSMIRRPKKVRRFQFRPRNAISALRAKRGQPQPAAPKQQFDTNPTSSGG
jgi:tetratricopeptide (TPR) repeat protein